ncbi:Nucleolar Complex 2 protein [Globomyces sp. JEL0801]|nr:Nucleolar Complex 2 protein [Globomyces sp. JEL0801]
MGKVKKSTKKFIKTKLTGELAKRKAKKQSQKYIKKRPTVDESSINQNASANINGEEDDDDVSDDDAGFLIDNLNVHENDEDDEEEDEEDMDIEEDDEEDDGQESEEETEESYKLELEKLKEKDPKFYEYLKENDENLLNFEVTEDDDEEEMDDGVVHVTREMIHSWRSSISKNHSLRALRKVLLAFKAAAAMGDPDKEVELAYHVEEGQVFNLVLLTAVKYAPIVFDHHIYGTDSERKGLPSAAKKWRKVQMLCKSFLGNLLKFMKKMTSLSMTRFELLNMWSTADEEQIRIYAFLCIRKMAIASPNPYLDLCIKGTYQTFAKVCKVTNAHSWTQTQFMDKCIVELCGLSLPSTYQHIFVYLRQLAMQLRTASTTKTKESFKAVYNWQFLHSVRLWCHLLSTYCHKDLGDTKESSILKPLIYPLVQIVIGAMRLKPSSKFFPLRLSIIRILIDLSEATSVYIPVASYLFEVFESAELKTKGKPSTLKPIDFQLNIRVPNTYIGTKTYHNGLVDEVVHLLFRYYSAHAFSIAFPELAIPAIIQLKRMVKHGKDFALNKQVLQLIEKLEQNSKFIELRRNRVSFGPKDLVSSLEFLNDVASTESPLVKYNESRMAIRNRQQPKEMMVADDDHTDSDSEVEAKAEKASEKPKASKKASKAMVDDVENDLDDDLVEDFELSDEE